MDAIPSPTVNYEGILTGLAAIGLLYIHSILSEFKSLVSGQGDIKETLAKNSTEIQNVKDRVSRLEESNE